MNTITPSLMFVGEQAGKAEQAMDLYVGVFEDSRIVQVQRFADEEEGEGIKHARLELAGREFTAMDSGGPHQFSFTPAISFTVSFGDADALDRAFNMLSDGGAVLMPLGEYPFSPRFAWVNDRFGVSWQLTLDGDA